MPTAKNRISVTLDDEQYDLLARLARLQGGSMSRILGDLLREMMPPLKRMTEAMEVAARAQEIVRDGMRRSAVRAERKIAPHAEALMRQYESFAQEIAEIASVVDREAGGAAGAPAHGGAAGEAPNPVITGATESQRSLNTPQRTRRRA